MTNSKYKKAHENLQDDSSTNHQQYLTILKELRALQQHLIPKNPVILKGYRLSSFYRPSHYLSGDLIDYVVIDTHTIGIFIVDVVGKGIPVSLTTIWISILFQQVIYQQKHPSPKETITQLNNSIHKNITLKKKSGFGFYGVLNIKTHTFTYCDFGVGASKLYRNNRVTELRQYGGAGIGFMKNTEYTEGSIQLQKNDVMIFATDGIEDVKDDLGKRIGDTWLDSLVSSYKETRAKEPLVNKIESYIKLKTKNRVILEDDIGCVGIEVVPRS